MLFRSLLALFSMLATTVMAEERTLFDFEESATSRWFNVNDGVMGGRSTGRFSIGDTGKLEFSGNLSLENNGGFASVRSDRRPLGLKVGESLVLRTRGDGREYSVNLYVPSRRIAFSYRAPLATKNGEWNEVTIPLKDFEATSFGRPVRNMPLDPADVVGIGILLGDKKAGPFQLEVDWIKVQ